MKLAILAILIGLLALGVRYEGVIRAECAGRFALKSKRLKVGLWTFRHNRTYVVLEAV